MSDTDGDALAPIIEAHLAHLEGAGPPASLDHLPEPLRAEARARITMLDALWGAKLPTPSLHDDPVARRFGFDRAGQPIALDGKKIARLRKAAGIELKDLVAMVNTAGGATTTRELFNLELASTTVVVPQRTASALSAALSAPLADFEADTSDEEVHAFRELLNDPRYDEIISEWAAEHHADVQTTRETVEQRLLLTARFRAEDVAIEQLLDAVRAILRRLEQP